MTDYITEVVNDVLQSPLRSSPRSGRPGMRQVEELITESMSSPGAGICLGGPKHGEVIIAKTNTFAVYEREPLNVGRYRQSWEDDEILSASFKTHSYNTSWVSVPLQNPKTLFYSDKDAVFLRCHVSDNADYQEDELMAMLVESIAALLSED